MLGCERKTDVARVVSAHIINAAAVDAEGNAFHTVAAVLHNLGFVGIKLVYG